MRVLEIAENGIKTVFITVLHTFQKLSRDIEDKKHIQIELQR